MPSSQQIILAMPESPARENLTAALDALDRQWRRPDRGSETPVVFCPSDATELGAVDGRKRVRVWSDGRTRRANNPFLDRSVRHVLGVEPKVDVDYLRTTLRQLGGWSFIHLSDVMGDGARIENFEITDSKQKSYILTAFNEFVAPVARSHRLRNSLETVADELITNALYNAPVLEGVRYFTGRSRAHNVRSDRPVKVQFAQDRYHVAFGIRDLYGSLLPEEVTDALFRCYRFGRHQIEEKEGGAGLGFYMLLQNANRLIINIDPKNFTEILILRRHHESWTQFAHSAPTFNLCLPDFRDPPPTRSHRRHRVHWRGYLKASLSHEPPIAAELLDVSARGAFVRLVDSDDDSANGLQVGATLHLELVGELNGVGVAGQISASARFPLQVELVVRWKGFNRRHRCRGLGVEFVKQMPVIEELALHY